MAMFRYLKAQIDGYVVEDAGQRPVGQVHKGRLGEGWIAEDEGVTESGFRTRDEAAGWLIGRRAIRGPQKTRVLAFDPTPAGLITKPLHVACQSLWQRLRTAHFAHTAPVFEICNDVYPAPKINGHEVYSFSDKFVRLERIAFVCQRCHDAIHFERTQSRAQAPYIQDIEDHYRRVNGGLSPLEFQQDFKEARQWMFGIRAFYRGASPPLGYGPFQEEAARLLARRVDRPRQKPLMQQLRKFAQSTTSVARAASPIEELALALAYNGVPADLPELRLTAERVIQALSGDGITIGRKDAGRRATLPEALAIGRDAVLNEALAQALFKHDARGGLPFLRVVAEGIIRDLCMEGMAIGPTASEPVGHRPVG